MIRHFYALHGWIVDRYFMHGEYRAWLVALWMVRQVLHLHQWRRDHEM